MPMPDLPMDFYCLSESPPYALSKTVKIPMGHCWQFLLPVCKLLIFKKVDCFNKSIMADALAKTVLVNVQRDAVIFYKKVLK